MSRTLRAFEYDSLRVGPEGLSDEQFNALVRFNERAGDRFFTVRHRAVRFNSYVGVLRVGSLTLEILPKADRSNDEARWRGALVGMLRVAGILDLEEGGAAAQKLSRMPLFDLFLQQFTSQVDEIVRSGLKRRYRSAEGNLPVLKGKLLVARQIVANAVHAERFYTRHTRYDADNVFNQLLAEGLRVVRALATGADLRVRASRLLEHFDGLSRLRVGPDSFSRLAYDRGTIRYRPALELARLILLGYQPDLRQGREDVLAFLFDMNALFEHYVLTLVQRAARSSAGGVTVVGQDSRLFWKGDCQVRLRPDIVVRLGARREETVVLDTKWKLLKAGRPDDHDLRQMYAYNRQFGATRSYLLYPRIGDASLVHGVFARAAFPDVAHGCGLWFLSLFDDAGKLDRRLGNNILEQLSATLRVTCP